MTIRYTGVEWNYDNLSGIGYNSTTLSEPYETWLYQITGATNSEKETINLGLSDGSDYNSIYNQKEGILKVTDTNRKVANRLDEDSFAISDSYNRKFIQKHIDSITLTDANYVKRLNKFKDDVLYFIDEARYISTDSGGQSVVVDQSELSGAVALFDFELKDGVWSEADFVNWCADNCPVNYDELRPFIPGEYEYKNAYVGFKLTIPPTTGRFGVANSTVYVDVEDTVEKGTAEATSGNLTTVTFSKRFYTSPHIMTSLVYATENCYVEVTEVSKEGFKFGLKSISSGQYLAGEISWLADGY